MEILGPHAIPAKNLDEVIAEQRRPNRRELASGFGQTIETFVQPDPFPVAGQPGHVCVESSQCGKGIFLPLPASR